MFKTKTEKLKDIKDCIKVIEERVKELERLLPNESCVSRKRIMQSNLKIGRSFKEAMTSSYDSLEATRE